MTANLAIWLGLRLSLSEMLLRETYPDFRMSSLTDSHVGLALRRAALERHDVENVPRGTFLCGITALTLEPLLP